MQRFSYEWRPVFLGCDAGAAEDCERDELGDGVVYDYW